MEAQILNNKIKVFRAQHNLTQEELAEKIGVSRQTVVAIEKGKYLPTLGLAFCIAKVFNTTVDNLFSK